MCSSPLPQLKLTSWAAQSGLLGIGSSDFIKLWSSIPSALPETRKSERPIGAIAISLDGSVALGTRSESHDGKGVAYYEGETNLWPAKDPKAITVGSYRDLPPFSSLASEHGAVTTVPCAARLDAFGASAQVYPPASFRSFASASPQSGFAVLETGFTDLTRIATSMVIGTKLVLPYLTSVRPSTMNWYEIGRQI